MFSEKISHCLLISSLVLVTVISGCGKGSGSGQGNGNIGSTQAALTALSLSGATLFPAFDPSVTEYASRVGSEISSITLIPATQQSATISVNGQVTASGAASQQIPLSVGDNVITVTVSNGTTAKTYRLTVTRNSGCWTWMTGDNTSNQTGIYGTKGVASATNKPGARDAAVSWTDSHGNLWLFGGSGYSGSGIRFYFNDLWKFDGTNWTWVSGDSVVDQIGVYGTKGVPSPTNKPGARTAAVSWVGQDGNLWLFGGTGYAASGSRGELNDLWKFDGLNWTWVSGDTIINQFGVYGVKDIASPANKPGARLFPVSWTDKGGNLWLFGGWGYASSSEYELNDLWKFDGTNWTWVSGDSIVNQPGIYGIKGVASAGNMPGSRDGAVSWTDSSGNLWLFGGFGSDGTGQSGYLNDLWKFDGMKWTWVSGDNTRNQNGVYGVKGIPSLTNIPGGRDDFVSWIDRNDNLWLSGGAGYAATGGLGALNDLWKFDGTNWTWVSGDNTTNQGAVYGTKAVTSPTNKPGAMQSRVAWTDAKGNFWLFGGRFYIDWTNDTFGNDLWKFEP